MKHLSNCFPTHRGTCENPKGLNPGRVPLYLKATLPLIVFFFCLVNTALAQHGYWLRPLSRSMPLGSLYLDSRSRSLSLQHNSLRSSLQEDFRISSLHEGRIFDSDVSMFLRRDHLFHESRIKIPEMIDIQSPLHAYMRSSIRVQSLLRTDSLGETYFATETSGSSNHVRALLESMGLRAREGRHFRALTRTENIYDDGLYGLIDMAAVLSIMNNGKSRNSDLTLFDVILSVSEALPDPDEPLPVAQLIYGFTNRAVVAGEILDSCVIINGIVHGRGNRHRRDIKARLSPIPLYDFADVLRRKKISFTPLLKWMLEAREP